MSLVSRSLATLFIVASLGSACALAEIVETSPGHLECETAAGQYDRIDVGRFVSGSKITGRFQYVASTHDRSRAAVSGYILRFHNGDEIEVHVMADPRNLRKLDVQLAISGKGSQTITRAPRGEPVEVTASVAGGLLTVESAGKTQSLPIGARRLVGVEASCQSGRFEVEFQSPPVA